MSAPTALRAPDPVGVITADGVRLATYALGEETAPVVLLVHGFASGFEVGWVRTGWVRDLLRAGFRVVGHDQRGHGASERPRDPGAYSLRLLVDDLLAVLDAHEVDPVGGSALVGYSLGARASWHAALEVPARVSRAVLGGVPDAAPLARVRSEQVRTALDGGPAPADPFTASLLAAAAAVPGNDLRALLALVEGVSASTGSHTGTGVAADLEADLDAGRVPSQPLLVAAGALDDRLPGSRRLAAAAPRGRFLEVPGRHHLNAPVSRVLREGAVAFLREGVPDPQVCDGRGAGAAP